MKKFLPGVLVVLTIVIGILLWRQIRVAESPHNLASVPPPTSSASTGPISALAPQTPAVKFPVPAESVDHAGAQQLPSLENSDSYMAHALRGLLGSQFVYKHLQLEDFMHRLVATTDNLGRSHAPSAIWPLIPTRGRFASMQSEGNDGSSKEIVMPDNDKRYAELARVIESLDTQALANLYFSAYPLFQKEYEELGFPNGYFNDRLVEILDLLIATPEPSEPLEVHLVDVQGSVKSTRPWVRYEFTDPNLQGLPAGQKIMLRVGKFNRQILRRKLSEFRSLVAARPATK